MSIEKQKSRSERWQERNPEKVKAIKRNWNENNKEKVKQMKKKYRETHPERVAEQYKNWRNKNKEKINDYLKIYQSDPDEKWKKIVRLNTLKKYGKAENCFFCNSKDRVEHHHLKPYNMDVFVDLCKNCHEQIHKLEDETNA